MWKRHWAQFSFVAFAAIICFSRFRFGHAPLQTYDDDFFYYLVASRNLIETGRCTFDGVHLTNGFHPLWFLVLTALRMVTKQALFFCGLQMLEFVLSLLTFYTVQLALRRRTQHLALVNIGALAVAAAGLLLARGGMEVALVFPLFSTWLWYRFHSQFQWRLSQLCLSGLLLSLLVLSRLDTVLLVAMVASVDGYTAWPVLRSHTTSVIAFLTGGLLFPLYLVTNRYLFHVWLPISGEAKQLRLHHWPSLRMFQSVFLVRSVPLQVLVWLSLLLMCCALMKYRSCTLPVMERRVALILLLFPFVHMGVISLLSDWNLWPWYFYPFVLSLLGSTLILLSRSTRQENNIAGQLGWTAAGAVIAVAAAISQPSTRARQQYAENLALAGYMDTHPGRYAMGDISGMLSYIVKEPMVQTEGLMEDRAFLNAIRKKEFLSDVLQRYGVDYYIPQPSYIQASCYAVEEPVQAGADSPRLRGTVCNGKALFRANTVGLHQVFALRDVMSRSPACCTPQP